MKNEIKTLVVCSKEEVKRIKETISKITSEVQIKYEIDNYQDALNIINEKTKPNSPDLIEELI